MTPEPRPLSTNKHVLELISQTPEAKCRRTPLFYAVELLRALRENDHTYFRAFGNRPARADQKGLLRSLADPIRDAVGQVSYVADDRDTGALERWQTSHSKLEPVVQARLMALAIEDLNILDFPRQLRRYYEISTDPDDPGSFMVGPGDPVPVCDSIFGVESLELDSSYGTSPRNLPRWRNPDRLKTVILAPEWVSRFDLRLNFSFDDDLRSVEEPPHMVATVHNARDLGEDVEWTAGGGRFSDVRLRDGLHRHGQLVDGIKLANSQGARLIVLPELCTTENSYTDLARVWADECTDDSALLIAGSRHQMVSGEDCWRNVVSVHGRSGATAEVTKTVPFVYSGRAGKTDEQLVEHLEFDPQPRIEIFCGDRITMMVFVCVDFLLDMLRDLARELDVSLIVVPSMSLKSGVFHGLIDGHTAATQAVVVFANVLMSKDERSRGYLGRSGTSDRSLSLDSAFDDHVEIDPAGVAFIDLDDLDRSHWVTL